MTLKNLPEIKPENPPSTFAFELDDDVYAKWDPGLRAEQSAENTITILDVIGRDMWGDGVTAKRISAALREIGNQEVFVEINSPGGDVFEGIAIYNALREHRQKVTVRVLGWAASAASVIAMAGDRIEIAKSGFMMLHNAWGVVIGNQFDLSAALEILRPIDDSLAGVYSDRAGVPKEKAAGWMKRNRGDGTWFNGQQAVEAGLADDFLPVDTFTDPVASKSAATVNAIRRLDTIAARAGMPRSERRSLFSDIKGGTRHAADTVTHDADDWTAAAQQLITTIRS